MDNNDRWKDDLLATSDITQEEFSNLPTAQRVWLVQNSHIFYNQNGNTILNLVHSKYKNMARMLKLGRYNNTYWNTTDLPKSK